ncbi:MAG: hypothetical protein K9M07_01095 [Simkaniaceae bacterium]|nr:hypothetical protein [Simkaniaceae bacterium]
MRYVKTYLMIAAFLLILFSLGRAAHDRIHAVGGEIGAVISSIKPEVDREKAQLLARIDELSVEKHLLTEMMSQLNEEQLSDRLLSHQIERFFEISQQDSSDYKSAQALRQQARDLGSRINSQMRFIRAKVVYREPGTWGSYCWINRGSENGEGVLSTNSPVVLGENVVGVVDYIGKYKSRVQLVTDSRLPISVQVLRGSEQNLNLLQHIERAYELLANRSDLSIRDEEKEILLDSMKKLSAHLKQNVGDCKLAKGEIFGSSFSLFRRKKMTLKGVGFNADLGLADRHQKVSDIVDKGDLLVTTGMDGIFPEGFHVAIVTEVEKVREADIAIHLEAKSTLINLEDIRYVEILPSLKLERDFCIDSM